MYKMLSQRKNDRLYYEKLQGKFDCRHYFGVCKKCDLPPHHGKGCTCALDFDMTCTCKKEEKVSDKYEVYVNSKQLYMLDSEISAIENLGGEESQLYFNVLFEVMSKLRKEFEYNDESSDVTKFYKNFDKRMKAYRFILIGVETSSICWDTIPKLEEPLFP